MKTTKIFISLFLALFCAGTTLNAQVRIGENNTPRTGTLLDLKSTFVGGLLLPNVSITDLSKIPAGFSDASVQSQDTNADLKGMIVYNTNTSTGEGVYVWDGNDWKSVGSGQGSAVPPATPGAISISPLTVTQGETFIASVTADPNATSYVWTLPNGLTGTSSSYTITITGVTAGTYPAGSIKVKAVNSAGSSAEQSSTTAVTVNAPAPVNTTAIANGVYVQTTAGYLTALSTGSNVATTLAQFTATGKTLYMATSDESGTKTWATAVAACAAKGSGWRLPTLGELANMQGKSGAPTSINYWSSTEDSTTYAWNWHFFNSVSYSYTKTYNSNVRCVWSD